MQSKVPEYLCVSLPCLRSSSLCNLEIQNFVLNLSLKKKFGTLKRSWYYFGYSSWCSSDQQVYCYRLQTLTWFRHSSSASLQTFSLANQQKSWFQFNYWFLPHSTLECSFKQDVFWVGKVVQHNPSGTWKVEKSNQISHMRFVVSFCCCNPLHTPKK